MIKILFYAEMHPIRESFTNHEWIVKEFLKSIGKDNDNFKILANHKIKQRINSSSILDLTDNEKIKLESFFKKKWDENSIEDWKSLMKGESKAYTEFYHAVLYRIKNFFDFNVLIYWGTNKTIKNFCEINNIPSIAMELGCTRKPYFIDTIYMDLQGVNGSSSCNNLNLDYVLNKKTNISKKIVEDDYVGVIEEKIEKIEQIKMDITLLNNWGKNILIPLQLDDDSNILLYSKHGSVFNFIKYCLNRLKNTEYNIYIKPHPGMKARKYNLEKHLEIENYVKNKKNVFWADNISNKFLIDKCNYILSINSSLSFEGMLKNKVVINQGGCCWNIEGALPDLEELIENKINYDKYFFNIDKISEFILEYYLIPYDKVFDKNNFINLVQEFIERYNKMKNKNKEYFEKPVSNTLDYVPFKFEKITKI